MRKDWWIGIALVLVAVLCIWQIEMTTPLELESDPGPLLFPRIAAIGLLLCGLGVVLSAKKEKLSKKLFNLQAAVLVAALIGYVILLDILGFLISTLLFVAFSVWWLSRDGEKKLVPALVAAVLVAGAVYYGFTEMFNVVLPRGVFN